MAVCEWKGVGNFLPIQSAMHSLATVAFHLKLYISLDSVNIVFKHIHCDCSFGKKNVIDETIVLQTY